MIAVMAMTIAIPALMPVLSAPAYAIDINTFTGGFDVSGGLPASDPRVIAANVIKIVLGFLGLLAVIIILIGGFKWMTSAGNEDAVADAKKILIAGVIGLVIILASWAIASFVLSSLLSAING